MFTLQFVPFLVRGIPPVTHPLFAIRVGEGGGCCGGGQGWAWLGGLSLPEAAAYTGGGRQWPQKPGGCGQTETQGQLPLSRSGLSLVNSKTHFSLSHVSSSRLSHSFNFFSLIDPSNDIFTEKAWCPAKSEPLTPLPSRW